ncbi:2Fe-2S iron-sulfur cluster-binding protein [Rhizobium sp. NZLR1]|uniref:2Fe-2S iron-sulfur cluster-binding protein n=1 Tax=Rhizobium sp. NZLR1 TaxID=2731096 RepID=UPI001A98BC19|nr:2Fe-2S iron-sulfur cluster-binding protein [Rhizobium sp. NZLR1]MBX5204044.1 2Fe-2S iron-sulfur cluster binding domain-containing protein [Rhizobium sp. NZLR1]QSZ25157.1 2Fe-2S iron-sulfur cluster binding domain-containing protein [Rhizobium sp. NZLR1]
MVIVTFVESSGARKDVEVPVGFSLMEIAVREGVDGIAAECGGACACATCHVYVDDIAFRLLGEPERMESDMLDFASAERRSNSRLSCQIKIAAGFPPFVVEIAPSQ